MDKKTTLEMIAAISNANGTSGFEDEVVAAIRPYAEGLGEITEDRMRNLYIRRKENNGHRYRCSGSLCTHTLRNFSLC